MLLDSSSIVLECSKHPLLLLFQSFQDKLLCPGISYENLDQVTVESE